MKTIFTTLLRNGCALALGCTLIAAHQANASEITLDLDSTLGAGIQFAGGAFSFLNSAGLSGNNAFENGFAFEVTNSNGTGAADGLVGNIGGTYTIGAITISGAVQTASVTGTGTFTINDGAGHNLSATVNWMDISTNGGGGTINGSGAVDLTGITYTGTNADLLALLTDGNGSAGAIATFQFISPIQNLTQLKASAGESTGYSITLATLPDGGSTVGLLGFGMLGLEMLRRKLKAA